MREQTRFKKKRDQLLQAYYEKNQGAKEEEEEEEKKEIDEEMSIIDEKIKEIEDFNKKNLQIDSEFLELFQDQFEKYNQEIVEGPFIEYNEHNLPSYYPKEFVI